MACCAMHNITVVWLHAGAGFLPYIPTWGKLLPGIVPATLVASVLFFTPVRAALTTDWCPDTGSNVPLPCFCCA